MYIHILYIYIGAGPGGVAERARVDVVDLYYINIG